MTLPDERTRSVLAARKFLLRIANASVEGGIKKIPSSVREEARSILRHFPLWYDLGRKDCWDEHEAMRIAEADDAADA